MDLNARLARLGQTVAAAQAERATVAISQAEQALAKRAAAWACVQAEEPDLAALLVAVKRTFGQPKTIQVSINGERII